MKTRSLKKSAIVMICLLLLCALVPTTSVQAANVTKTGFYSANVGTKRSAKEIGAVDYLRNVRFSGNKMTTYGNFVYTKSFYASYNTFRELKAKKRTFKLAKKPTCYLYTTKVKKISKKSAIRILKNLNSDYDVTFQVKNKKITKIYLFLNKT